MVYEILVVVVVDRVVVVMVQPTVVLAINDKNKKDTCTNQTPNTPIQAGKQAKL